MKKEYKGIFLGYDYIVWANPMGFLCGYVRLKKTDALFKKDYFQCEEPYDVHGGLTFSGELENESGWWIGFDCAHGGDGYDETIMSDDYKHLPRHMVDGRIWRRDEVIRECEHLIMQIVNEEKNGNT